MSNLFGDYYPPGCSGAAVDGEWTYRCPNEECDGGTWQVPGYEELGGAFLNDEADAFCPECGTEGVECD